MRLGFEFRQTLRGRWWRADEPAPLADAPPSDDAPGALSLAVAVRVHSVRRFLLDPTAELEGSIHATGLADHRPLRGTLEILPVVRRKLVYDFRFPTDDGADCRFHGEAELDPLHLVEGSVALDGAFFVDEREVAEGALRLDVRDELLGLVRSFRRR